MSRRLWLSLRRLLEVHSSGDCGSPRVSGSTSAQIIEQIRIRLAQRPTTSAHPAYPFQVRRLACTQFGQPASDRAARDTGGTITAMIPPCPADVASAAAKRRRPRSSSTGARASKRGRMADSSITPKRYSLATPEGLPPANKIRPDQIHLFADGPLVRYPLHIVSHHDALRGR